jgi:hypothetical protein
VILYIFVPAFALSFCKKESTFCRKTQSFQVIETYPHPFPEGICFAAFFFFSALKQQANAKKNKETPPKPIFFFFKL